MLINLRNALMTGRRLPYDAEVEYLESTGTQWIDTGIVAGDDTTFSVRFNCTSMVDTAIYGGRSQAQGRQWILPLQMNQIQFGYGRIYQNINVQYRGFWLDLDTSLSSESYTYRVNVDGGAETTVSTPRQTFTNTANVLLFAAWNNTAVGYKTTAKVAMFKIWKNSVLVRDYIPVRVGTVGAMYDRVSGALFGNAGSGDFVLGPDVVPVEYIESTGTQWIDTGVKADLPLQLEADIDFTNPNTGTNVQCLCGGYRDSARFWIASLPQGKLNCGLTNNAISAANVPVGKKASLNVVFENGRQTGTIDGVQFVSASNTTSNYWFRDYNLRIFHMFGPFIGNNNWPLQAKLYGCRLFINSSAPVRSFRPVRVGTDATSWEGAMMDVLTRRIYRNAGTGAFTYGNDLKYPIPAE